MKSFLHTLAIAASLLSFISSAPTTKKLGFRKACKVGHNQCNFAIGLGCRSVSGEIGTVGKCLFDDYGADEICDPENDKCMLGNFLACKRTETEEISRCSSLDMEVIQEALDQIAYVPQYR